MRIPIIIMSTLLWILTVIAPAMAEVSVRAEVDRTTVGPGESIDLQVTVTGGQGEVDLSGLTDFKVVSRGTSSSLQIINGQMSREVTYNYLLIARRQGRLTIPALPVEVDNKIYHSNPIVITVSDQTNTGGSGSSEREVWVTAQVSNSTPFEGQQIIYSFRVHNTVQINDAKFQPPDFEGFSSRELKDRLSDRRIINGRETIVTEITYILTPLSAGARTIEPGVLQVGIIRPDRNRRRSPFDDFFNRNVVDSHILQSDAVTLEVRPLPPPTADIRFSGLIGQFEIRAEMESSNLKVGDSGTLAVTVEGQGNIMDARPPDVDVPPAFKTYADNPQEDVIADRKGFHGKKVFRTALVPLQAGRFALPSVTLDYFDTNQGAYRRLTASVPELTVAPQEKPDDQVSIAPEPLQPIKKKVIFTGRDILPPKENLTAIQSRQPISGMVFLIGLAIPALVFAGSILFQRFHRRDSRPAAVMKAKALRALKAAQTGPAESFTGQLYQALTAAILSAAGRQGAALTWKEAESLLIDSGRSVEEARQTADLLAEIESGQFSGRSMTAPQQSELLARTRQTIRKLVS